MKFFSTSQVRELDKFTIENEPISSIDLMERAAQTLYLELLRRVESDRKILIFAGPGNNGGDALALARMLLQSTFDVQVVLLHTGKLSADCDANRQRLLDRFPAAFTEQTSHFKAPFINESTVIIDGLFGSGLTRPLTGIFADAVKWINDSGCTVYSIDIPSGLQGEENIPPTPPDKRIGINCGEQDTIPQIIKADYTFSLQFPKLAFLLPECAEFVGKWDVFDIGIHPKVIAETETPYYFLEKSDIQQVLKPRLKFSHKGTFGHALIVAGSRGMAGASVLAGKSALRGGAGLVTVHSPRCNRNIVQSSVAELIFQSDENKNTITKLPKIDNFTAIAVGPGIGTSPEAAALLGRFLQEHTSPTVLDADALNIIGQNPHLQEYIQNDYILTPHPKEFERLLGQSCKNSYERMKKASEMSQDINAIIILKGAYTLIALPDGRMIFNSTGNSGMATAGSGDVLTGILVSLLAQGYTPEETAKLGVYIHGLAGDLALKNQSKESLMAGDIIDQLGEAFKLLKAK